MLFVYGIASGPVYRTESLRAIIGRECLHGHWLFPVLYGEPFLTKPPGQYVAIGLVSLPFGEVTAATARIPSVIAATAAVFLMFGLFRRVLDERAGLLAALLLPTSILWLDKVPSAEIDMTLVGWVTASLVLFHRSLASGMASVENSPVPHGGYLCLALLCMAGGTLTKWTAPAFFYLTVIPLLVWRKQLRLLLGMRHLLAVTLAVAVCAGWAAAVAHEVGWNTLTDTVLKEAAYRFAPKPGAKGYPWADVATYPFVVLLAHLPAAAFAIRTFRPSFWRSWDERGRLLLQLLHCWTWPNLLFWSIVPNHNVRYSLPMSPGLMGLGAMGLIGWLRDRKSNEGKEAASPFSFPVAPAFLALWLAAKALFVLVAMSQRAAHHNPIPAATALRDHVPADVTLYLFRLKDEGVMFYYDRPALRLSQPHDLPPGAYAALIRQEWEELSETGKYELIATLADQQGDPVILVKSRAR